MQRGRWWLCALLLLLYLFVAGRSIYLAMQTQDTYARLLAGSLAFVDMGGFGLREIPQADFRQIILAMQATRR